MVTDHIADMLTRIRNASMVKHDSVRMPVTKLKVALAEIMKEEGFIADFRVDDKDGHGKLYIELRYGAENEPVVRGIKRISKPGIRRYVGAKEIPKVLNGLGVAILSTSKGILTDRACRRQNVGGEVLCYIW